MEFGKGIVFILTREDIASLARESNIPEEVIDDRFLKEISDGVKSLVEISVRRFMKEVYA